MSDNRDFAYSDEDLLNLGKDHTADDIRESPTYAAVKSAFDKYIKDNPTLGTGATADAE